MKQTIEIEVPDGKKAVWKDGRVIFEDIKPQLPKTWVEFCNQNKIRKGECSIDIYGNTMEHSRGVGRSYIYDRNLLPNKEVAEAHLALMQLHQLRDCYRQGWIPNWNDSTSTKYCIEFTDNRYIIFWDYASSKFLSFPTKELAEKFLTNFRKLIKQAGDLI